MSLRFAVTATLAALLSVALAPLAEADPPKVHEVGVSKFWYGFYPPAVVVNVGDVIRFQSHDWSTHRVVSNDGLVEPEPMKVGSSAGGACFDTGILPNYGSFVDWTVTLVGCRTVNGAIPYRDAHHPELRGSVFVREAMPVDA